MTLEETIAKVVRDVVTETLDEMRPREQQSGPAPLLDRAGLAKALNVSVPTIDKLRRQKGFPEVRVLDAPRFDLAEVREWLRCKSWDEVLP